MALINPVSALVVPFLFVATAPLAVFAAVTTAFAFSALLFRVLVVYLDITLSLVPQYFADRGRSRHPHPHRRPRRRHHPLRHDDQRSLSPASTSSDISIDLGPPTPTPTPALALAPAQHQPIFRRRRRRPSSATSVVSAGSTTPIGDVGLGLMPSVGPERDFEGVGGWRDGKDDDESWTAINSRLEYPDRTHARSHHRTPSGGLVTPGDAHGPDARHPKTPTSPNSCRTRTPSGSRMSLIGVADSDGYFPLAMSPTAPKKPMSHPI
ncbi:hypothetical protein TOPH_06880 [Tolypocladium ophioglossoides CBS 100239]|uniref:Uncharacterized protein n=1 Tax=Tolypocladium ophioglossoides (strain CBS 100239) TaxID=1163406 RepID=A0A0L0N3U4_TOLOC|nr:hypothetical protein TOPH_06880 [Tolypocladium ophioglossoides CBS 100239]